MLQTGRSGVPWTVENVKPISVIRAPAIGHDLALVKGRSGASRVMRLAGQLKRFFDTYMRHCGSACLNGMAVRPGCCTVITDTCVQIPKMITNPGKIFAG